MTYCWMSLWNEFLLSQVESVEVLEMTFGPVGGPFWTHNWPFRTTKGVAENPYRYLGSRSPRARACSAWRHVGRLRPIADGGRCNGCLILMPSVMYRREPPCPEWDGRDWIILCSTHVSFSSSQCVRLIIFVTSSAGIKFWQTPWEQIELFRTWIGVKRHVIFNRLQAQFSQNCSEGLHNVTLCWL